MIYYLSLKPLTRRICMFNLLFCRDFICFKFENSLWIFMQSVFYNHPKVPCDDSTVNNICRLELLRCFLCFVCLFCTEYSISQHRKWPNLMFQASWLIHVFKVSLHWKLEQTFLSSHVRRLNVLNIS